MNNGEIKLEEVPLGYGARRWDHIDRSITRMAPPPMMRSAYGGGSQCNGHISSSYYKGNFCKGLKHVKGIHKNIGQHSNQYTINQYQMGNNHGTSIEIKDNKQISTYEYLNNVYDSSSRKDTSSENIMYDDEGNRVS